MVGGTDVAGPDAGPVGRGDRLLAPDLARGLALLGIALANCVSYVSGSDLGPLLRPVRAGTADRVVDVLVGLLVDNRAFPMFTMLFAYGFVTVLRRQAAAGVPWPAARSLLVRRSLWLSVFGAVHTVLLFSGDILLGYGLLGLGLVLVVRAGDRPLRLLGWATLPAFVLLGALDGTGLPDPGSLGYVADLVQRVLTGVSTVAAAPLYVAALAPPAVVGVLLARARVLEEPSRHLPLLRRTVLVGLPLSVLGAVPLVLLATGAVDAPLPVRLLAGALHGGTGLLGAAAFLAGVGWWTAAREGRSGPAPHGAATSLATTSGADRGSADQGGADHPGADHRGAARHGVVRALAAVGERSLTCYLLQSVLLVPLLSPWALGLGEGAGTARVSAIAVAVYLVTLLVAVVLDRAGRRGPAEVLLRRLVYPDRAGRTPAVPPAAPA